MSFGGKVGLTAAAETVGAFTVTGGTNGTDYDYADNLLTIKTDTPITISGTTVPENVITAIASSNAEVTVKVDSVFS